MAARVGAKWWSCNGGGGWGPSHDPKLRSWNARSPKLVVVVIVIAIVVVDILVIVVVVEVVVVVVMIMVA
jgi:hypothetical protein